MKNEEQGEIMLSFRHSIKFFLLVMFIGWLFPLSAQWNNNPLQNLSVCNSSGEQILPRIAPTSDGGCYISWFDSRNGSYALYMQRLNTLGEKMWSAQGLLISDHPQQSWLTDYDLAVDHQDNAIVVFSDVRNGGISGLDVFAYKIAPDGTFLWGPDGIGLSDIASADFEPSPRVTVTGTNHIIVAWNKTNSGDRIGVQRLSPDGQKMWGMYGLTLQGAAGENLSRPVPVPSGPDSVIIVWKNATGPFWAPTTRLYAQKFGPNGNALWDSTGVLFYNLGNISAWSEPVVRPASDGGIFIAYYDSPTSSRFDVWVQRLSKHGNLIFPMNGIKTTTNLNNLHMNPALTVLPDQQTVCFWLETDLNQTQFALYGQKISATGNRMWGENGRLFIPFTNRQISHICARRVNNQIYLGYLRMESATGTNKAVEALISDSSGALLVAPLVLSAASLGDKTDLQLALNTESRAFFTWSDQRNDNGDIYAQNINPDGTLGNLPPGITIVEPPDSAQLTQFPVTVSYTTTGVIVDSTHNVRIMVQLNSDTLFTTIQNPILLDTLFAPENLLILELVDTTGVPLSPFAADSVLLFYPASGFAHDGSPGGLHIQFYPNYPNPFNLTTRIRFSLSRKTHLKLSIFNILGEKIAVLIDRPMAAGIYQVDFDARNLPPGIYFYQLKTAGFRQIRKMVLIK